MGTRQGFAESQIHVHRPRTGGHRRVLAEGGRPRLVGHGLCGLGSNHTVFGGRNLTHPAHACAEHALLNCGLVAPDAAELLGPISGEQDQRNSRMVGL